MCRQGGSGNERWRKEDGREGAIRTVGEQEEGREGGRREGGCKWVMGEGGNKGR